MEIRENNWCVDWWGDLIWNGMDIDVLLQIYYSFCLFEWKLERIIGALIGGEIYTILYPYD